MKCSQCNAEVADNFKFCPQCSAPVPQAPAGDGDIVAVRSTVITAGTVNVGDDGAAMLGGGECPICGKYNRRDETFRCKRCGRELICTKHQHSEWHICQECATKQAEEQAERERAQAQREAEARARREQEERVQREREEQAKRAWLREQNRTNQLVLTLAPDVRLELVRVPAGEFLMGSDKQKDADANNDELPQQRVYLAEFLIGKYPVTVAQFAAFVKATNHQGWFGDLAQKANHPAVNIFWDDAVAFYEWASNTTGHIVRLPTEAEWEKAARGTDGRIYPWGNESPDDTRANFAKNLRDGSQLVDTFRRLRISQSWDNHYI